MKIAENSVSRDLTFESQQKINGAVDGSGSRSDSLYIIDG